MQASQIPKTNSVRITRRLRLRLRVFMVAVLGIGGAFGVILRVLHVSPSGHHCHRGRWWQGVLPAAAADGGRALTNLWLVGFVDKPAIASLSRSHYLGLF